MALEKAVIAGDVFGRQLEDIAQKEEQKRRGKKNRKKKKKNRRQRGRTVIKQSLAGAKSSYRSLSAWLEPHCSRLMNSESREGK